MEKSRLVVILIFIIAIPAFISKNIKEMIIQDLSDSFIAETEKYLKTNVSASIKGALAKTASIKYNKSKMALDNFRQHFQEYKSVNIINKNYEFEVKSGLDLKADSDDLIMIKESLKTGESTIFFKLSEDSRVYTHMIVPFLDKTDETWKCIYVVVDLSAELASYTKPITKPFHVFFYLYNATNKIILPSYSNLNLGMGLIHDISLNKKIANYKGSSYFLHKTKIDLNQYFINVIGLYVVLSVPSSFMGHLMFEYRVKTIIAIIIICFILILLFIDFYLGYRRMNKELKLYIDMVQNTGVAIIMSSLKNDKIIEVNKMARNVFFLDVGKHMKQIFSKDSDRLYVEKIISTIGQLYHYKVAIRAKNNEEVDVVLSLSVDYERQLVIVSFFEKEFTNRKALFTKNTDKDTKNLNEDRKKGEEEEKIYSKDDKLEEVKHYTEKKKVDFKEIDTSRKEKILKKNGWEEFL